MDKALRTILLLTGFAFFSQAIYAATYTSTQAGAWNSSATWGGAGTPGDGDVVIVKHAVTWPGASYTWWSSASSITIQDGGKLTRTGNLTLTGVGWNITLTKNASFEVTGNLTLDNSVQLKGTDTGATGTGSVITVGGSVNLVNSSQVVLASTSKMTVTNTFTNQDSGSTTNNAGSLTAGTLVVYNTVTNSGTMTLTTLSIPNGTLTNSGQISVSGATTLAGGALNSSGTLSLTSFTASNGTFRNSGQATVTGLTTLSGGVVELNPGATTSSRFTIKGTLNMTAWGNVTVGNGVPGTPKKYADLVVEGTMQDNAGHVTVDCNGRVAVFGDLNLNNWPNFTIKSCGTGVGGQVYVDGDGAGNSVTSTQGHVINQNASPYGLYVNGPTTGDVSPAAASIATMQSTNSDFYNWVASLPNSPLPVKLQYFKVADISENGISLEWATSMEKNFSHFEVQRAGADLLFSTISIVQGRGGLEVKTVYALLDAAPANGKNYYRLKAIDLDNSFEYFNMIVADWNSDIEGVSLYPNPAVNYTFTLSIGDEYSQPVHLTVYESKGYAVYSASLEGPSTTVTLPEGIAPGIYFVRVSSAAKQQVIRLVVK